MNHEEHIALGAIFEQEFHHPDRPTKEQEEALDFEIAQAALEGRESPVAAYLALHPNQSEQTARQVLSRKKHQGQASLILDEALKARAAATGVSTSWVVNEFVDCYNECRGNADMKNALRALESLKDHVPGFDKNKPHGVAILNAGNGKVQVNMVEVRLAKE